MSKPVYDLTSFFAKRFAADAPPAKPVKSKKPASAEAIAEYKRVQEIIAKNNIPCSTDGVLSSCIVEGVAYPEMKVEYVIATHLINTGKITRAEASRLLECSSTTLQKYARRVESYHGMIAGQEFAEGITVCSGPAPKMVQEILDKGLDKWPQPFFTDEYQEKLKKRVAELMEKARADPDNWMVYIVSHPKTGDFNFGIYAVMDIKRDPKLPYSSYFEAMENHGVSLHTLEVDADSQRYYHYAFNSVVWETIHALTRVLKNERQLTLRFKFHLDSFRNS